MPLPRWRGLEKEKGEGKAEREGEDPVLLLLPPMLPLLCRLKKMDRIVIFFLVCASGSWNWRRKNYSGKW